jgi:hypothetical protein
MLRFYKDAIGSTTDHTRLACAGVLACWRVRRPRRTLSYHLPCAPPPRHGAFSGLLSPFSSSAPSALKEYNHPIPSATNQSSSRCEQAAYRLLLAVVYWVSTVVDERSAGEGAAMIIAGYRLAPDYPHPVGVEYGVDTVLWTDHIYACPQDWQSPRLLRYQGIMQRESRSM